MDFVTQELRYFHLYNVMNGKVMIKNDEINSR